LKQERFCLRKPSRGQLGPLMAMAAIAVSSNASAMDIDSGNPDTTIRFDNSVRYNLGVRAQQRNPEAYNTTDYDESDSKFSRGRIVTNRVDLLSELDVVYKKRYGARVSGSAWYDHAYRNTTVEPNPAFTVPGLGSLSSAYPNNEYTSYVKRWNRGVSGEILDAFVFGGFDVGTVPVDFKIGRHNVYWGESLFSFVHGVSTSQGPVDVRKAYTNPGVEAKELFLPLTQISGQALLSPRFSVAGQYLLDWKPSRIPDGGTYLGLADYFTAGGGTYVVNPAAATAAALSFGLPPGAIAPVPFLGTPDKPKKRGDWGVKASWRPEALDGALGFYYREYTDKLPQIVAGGFQPGLPVPTDVRFTYLEAAKLYGISLSKEVGGLSVGAEIAYRKNGGLLMAATTVKGAEPRGDTVHALVNILSILPPTPLWNSGSIAAEMTYSRLQKVRANAANYNGLGYGCASGNMMDGCASRDNWGFAIKFEPVWYQAIAGVDLKAPIVYQTGLKGNSPVLFGGYEGSGSFSLGLTAEVKNAYSVALAYNGYFTKYKTTANALGQPSVGAVNGVGYIADRGWLSMTLKTTF
jgi:hypothetical protein